jgi:COP9 signalosome complex subunit 3
MEKLINAILSLSGSDTDLKQLKNSLTKEENSISKNLHFVDDSLAALDPGAHSLGYAFLLAAKAGSKVEPNKFLNQVQRFLAASNGPQIRLAPNKIIILCRRFKELCLEANQSIRAVKPLRIAITKLRPSSEVLTPLHADFLQVCLHSKCYNAAREILDTEVFEVNPEATTITSKDVLLFYYYGGMAYTGLKQFKKALNFFRLAVSMPAQMLSAIMVEAYKKYVLLSLLVHGKLLSLPRYTSNVVVRYQKNNFPQYQEFANAFAAHNTDDLHKIAQTHIDIFNKDKNFGLVKQCIQSLYIKNIQRQTQTYLTFSFQDMAAAVKLGSPVEAEKHLLRMIEKGEIFASINQKDGMVSFQESVEQYDTKGISNQINDHVQKVIQLGRKIRSIDETIGSSAHYIQKTSVHERGRWPEFGCNEHYFQWFHR